MRLTSPAYQEVILVKKLLQEILILPRVIKILWGAWKLIKQVRDERKKNK